MTWFEMPSPKFRQMWSEIVVLLVEICKPNIMAKQKETEFFIFPLFLTHILVFSAVRDICKMPV
jgi:hypothetical protein